MNICNVSRSNRWATPLILCVGLGILLRVFRYALNSPLWWNEAFLAINLPRRGWLELLNALDYHQVCPIGFLWVEKAVVSLAGFHEWSLRLAPLLSGIGSLLGMSLLARATMPRRLAWFAVLMLAVSYHPIRLASEVKPYATDLAVATWTLGLSALAIRSGRSQPRSLGLLIVLAPLFLSVSYPSIFVLAGSAVVVFLKKWPQAESGTRLKLVGLGLSVGLSFCGLQMLAASAQTESAGSSGMTEFWAEGLPRWQGAGSFLAWLWKAHTGPLFAFPAGDGPEVSLPALVLAGVGAWALYRRRRWALLGLFLAPFAFTLIAALAGRYPYGARARVVQHLVPCVCVLMVLGGNQILIRLSQNRNRRHRLAGVLSVALVLVGVLPLIPDYLRPARTARELGAREFAQAFWPSLGQEPIICLRWDLGIQPWDSLNPDVALYLCNQAIYSSGRQRTPLPNKASGPDHQLNSFVIFDSPAVPETDLGTWLAQQQLLLGPLHERVYWVPGHEGRPARVRVISTAGLPARSTAQQYPAPQQPGSDSGPEDSHVREVVSSTR